MLYRLVYNPILSGIFSMKVPPLGRLQLCQLNLKLGSMSISPQSMRSTVCARFSKYYLGRIQQKGPIACFNCCHGGGPRKSMLALSFGSKLLQQISDLDSFLWTFSSYQFPIYLLDCLRHQYSTNPNTTLLNLSNKEAYIFAHLHIKST